MSRSAIEDKLRYQLLSRSRLTEARVVYILVEVRKLMELQNEFHRYPAVRFCCDWALHTNLDRGEAKKILQVFDKAHPYISVGDPVPPDIDQQIRRLISFDDFRQEFTAFMKAYGLPDTIILNRWTRFIQSYGDVVEDCPLTVAGPNLQNLRSVTLYKIDARPHLLRQHRRLPPYLLRWVALAKDPNNGSWELQIAIS